MPRYPLSEATFFGCAIELPGHTPVSGAILNGRDDIGGNAVVDVDAV
jgi:hypothetical protein